MRGHLHNYCTHSSKLNKLHATIPIYLLLELVGVIFNLSRQLQAVLVAEIGTVTFSALFWVKEDTDASENTDS